MSSSRNPTIKRILKEASELATSPSSDFHAAPLENDLFEWHFTLRGTSQSPYENGIYHGRIVLPPAYPLKPPSFRFLTPSGRFEANREICLSISGHHEETWQPAWGIRTALVAIRSFMDTDAKGQVGGMDASEEVRKRLAGQSVRVRCVTCGKTNEEIMAEQDEAVKEAGGGEDEGGKKREEVVPEELRLAYREDLGKNSKEESEGVANGSTSTPNASSPQNGDAIPPAAANSTPPQAPEKKAAQHPTTVPTEPVPVPVLTAPTATAPLVPPPPREEIPAWIDKAIYGIIILLAFCLWQKLVG